MAVVLTTDEACGNRFDEDGRFMDLARSRCHSFRAICWKTRASAFDTTFAHVVMPDRRNGHAWSAGVCSAVGIPKLTELRIMTEAAYAVISTSGAEIGKLFCHGVCTSGHIGMDGFLHQPSLTVDLPEGHLA